MMASPAQTQPRERERRARRIRLHPATPLFGTVAAVVALALIKFAATIATAGAYGWHRDELYYLASSHHLALGYVDYPPVAPLLARLDTTLLGTSLVGLRLATALAGIAIVLLTGRLARELGGNATAQFLAALAVVAAPMYLGSNGVFETVTFDELTWLIVILLVVRLLNTGNPRLWLLIGLAAGIGLETKYTIVGLLLGLAVGVLATPVRTQLRTRWPWLGVLIAAALLAPNLVWQVQHDWPSLAYLLFHHGKIAQETSRTDYILQQVILIGPLALPLAVAGAVSLFRRPQYRLLGWACVVVELAFFLTGGKSYYPGPIYVLLFAAGSVAAVRFFGTRRWASLTTAGTVLAGGLLLLPLCLPILPGPTMVKAGLWKVRTDYADEVGWPELVASVARVYHRLPVDQRSETAILTSNYGEAGAIDYYGPRLGLPHALSGHLTYYYWKPAHVNARILIAVGIPRSGLTPLYRDIRPAGVIHNRLGMQNEEWGAPIYVCRDPKVSLDKAWPSQFHLD